MKWTFGTEWFLHTGVGVRSAGVHLSPELCSWWRGYFQQMDGSDRGRCVLPMPPPHPAPNAEVNYGGVSCQRRRTERRKSERRFMYRQEWDPSLPHTLPTMLLISHTHTHTHSHKSISITVMCNYTVQSHTLPLAEPQSAHDAELSQEQYIYNVREHACSAEHSNTSFSCKIYVHYVLRRG